MNCDCCSSLSFIIAKRLSLVCGIGPWKIFILAQLLYSCDWFNADQSICSRLLVPTNAGRVFVPDFPTSGTSKPERSLAQTLAWHFSRQTSPSHLQWRLGHLAANRTKRAGTNMPPCHHRDFSSGLLISNPNISTTGGQLTTSTYIKDSKGEMVQLDCSLKLTCCSYCNVFICIIFHKLFILSFHTYIYIHTYIHT